MINIIKQIKEKKVRGFAFVATFGDKPGGIVDAETVTNKVEMREFISLIASLSEAAGVEDDVIKLLLTSKLRG